jgi:two-component system, NarL family, response regulator NreC
VSEIPPPDVPHSVTTNGTRESSSGRPIRVALADDHDVTRRNLRLILERAGDVEVTGEVGDLRATEAHVRSHRPHVLVLDLAMPNGSSIETISRLRRAAPNTEIVVLTNQVSPVFASHALEAGAVGFVRKDLADAELGEAVSRAARGAGYVTPEVAVALAGLRHSVEKRGLTERETEVLRLIALGYTSREIADELHLSSRTVETYRERIHRKTRFASRRAFVQYALRHGLLSA